MRNTPVENRNEDTENMTYVVGMAYLVYSNLSNFITAKYDDDKMVWYRSFLCHPDHVPHGINPDYRYAHELGSKRTITREEYYKIADSPEYETREDVPIHHFARYNQYSSITVDNNNNNNTLFSGYVQPTMKISEMNSMPALIPDKLDQKPRIYEVESSSDDDSKYPMSHNSCMGYDPDMPYDSE